MTILLLVLFAPAIVGLLLILGLSIAPIFTFESPAAAPTEDAGRVGEIEVA